MAGHYATRRIYHRRAAAPPFSITRLVVLAAGVVFLAFGIVAMARAGLSGPLDQPMVDVLGFPHTALLGIFEAVAGALLILSGLGSIGSPLALVVGLALVVAGVLFLGQLDWFMTHLSNDSSFGWVPVVGGGAVVVSLVALP
jgi:hypothetical protein